MLLGTCLETISPDFFLKKKIAKTEWTFKVATN